MEKVTRTKNCYHQKGAGGAYVLRPRASERANGGVERSEADLPWVKELVCWQKTGPVFRRKEPTKEAKGTMKQVAQQKRGGHS